MKYNALENPERIKQRFSIRKLSIGAASVLLGTTLLLGAQTQSVHAETTNLTSQSQTTKKVTVNYTDKNNIIIDSETVTGNVNEKVNLKHIPEGYTAKEKAITIKNNENKTSILVTKADSIHKTIKPDASNNIHYDDKQQTKTVNQYVEFYINGRHVSQEHSFVTFKEPVETENGQPTGNYSWDYWTSNHNKPFPAVSINDEIAKIAKSNPNLKNIHLDHIENGTQSDLDGSKNITYTDSDRTIKVYLTSDKTTTHVQMMDIDANMNPNVSTAGQVIKTVDIQGFYGDSISKEDLNTIQNVIQQLTDKGYEIKSNPFNSGNMAYLAENGTIQVGFLHKTKTMPAKRVTFTRNIHYVTEDKKPILLKDNKPAIVTQNATWDIPMIYDYVTKDTTADRAYTANKAKLDAVKSPTYTGYIPDIDTVGAIDNISPQDRVIDTYVTYRKSSDTNPDQTVTQIVNFTLNGKVIGTQTIKGTKGQTTPVEIKIPNGYKLAQDLPKTITLSDTPINIAVKEHKVPFEQAKHTVQYVTTDDTDLESILSTKTYSGDKGSSFPFKPEVPDGFELKSGQNIPTNLTFDNSTTKLYVVHATKTQTINYKDEQGNIVGKQDISGKIGQAVTFKPQVPSGYKIKDGQNIPSMITIGNKVDDIIVVKDVPNPKPAETITQTVNYKDEQGNTVGHQTVSGKKGDNIAFKPNVPSGYKIKDGQNIPPIITIGNKINDIIVVKDTPAPKPDETITQTINYKDEQGNTISHQTVSGKKGDKVDFKPDVPSGYKIKDGQNIPSTITIGDKVNDIIVVKDAPAPKPDETITQIINYKDEQGNIVGHQNISGKKGDKVNFKPDIPSGYKIKDGQNIPATITIGDKVNDIIVVKDTPAPKPDETITQTINYKDEQGNTVGHQNISGKKGDKVNFKPNVPSGYKIKDGQNTPSTITIGNKINDIIVVKDTPAPKPDDQKDRVSQTVQYKDPDGNILSTQVFTGQVGTSMKYKVSLPYGYKVKPGSNVPTSITFTRNNQPIVINIIKENSPSKPETIITQTVNFKDEQGNIVGQQNITGIKGNKVPFKPEIPDGYKLKDGQTIPKTIIIGDKVNDIIVVKDTPDSKPAETITQNINYKDTDGKIIRTDTITGHKGEKVPFKPSVPVGYKLKDGQNIPSTITIGDKVNDIIIVKDTPEQTITQTVNYKNEQGNTVGHQTLTGEKGTTVPFKPEVPNGYKLKDGQNIPTTITMGNKINDIIVVEDTTKSIINYRDPNGNIVSIQTIIGKKGDKVSFTPSVPSGYKIKDGQNIPQVITIGDKVNDIQVVKNNYQTQEIDYVDEHGNTVKQAFIGAQEGSTFPFEPDIPEGYHLDPNAEVPTSITYKKNSKPIKIKVIKDTPDSNNSGSNESKSNNSSSNGFKSNDSGSNGSKSNDSGSNESKSNNSDSNGSKSNDSNSDGSKSNDSNSDGSKSNDADSDGSKSNDSDSNDSKSNDSDSNDSNKTLPQTGSVNEYALIAIGALITALGTSGFLRKKHN